MHTFIIDSMKRLYLDGKKTKDEFIQRVVEGTLTIEEYLIITGEEYENLNKEV